MATKSPKIVDTTSQVLSDSDGKLPAPVSSSGNNPSISDPPYPVVALYASEDALEDLTTILQLLPVNTGMAFVCLCPKPTPDFSLTSILSRVTSIPVQEAFDGTAVFRNTIYVAPAETPVVLKKGVLRVLTEEQKPQGTMPLDYFLQSLAEDIQHRAIAVLLSGIGPDGILGIKAVKAAGGLTFASNPNTSRHEHPVAGTFVDEMADTILLPRDIVSELGRINEYALTDTYQTDADALFAGKEHELQIIFTMLWTASNVDFTNYKPTTIKRRIARRMLLGKIRNLEEYITYLRSNKSELEALYEDLLINVTHFFREAESFEALKKTVFPRIGTNRQRETPIRIWVAGCSTGEESYSIAIAILEYMDNVGINLPVQIFATDISEVSIRKARSGVYPENISSTISPERLRRFFVKVEGGYRVGKTVRDMCIFARQDVTSDPPFSTIDLITCRNMLIYMNTELQNKVLRTFHYALQVNGYMMLGSSETIGVLADLFTLTDKKNKIYSKKPTASPFRFEFSFNTMSEIPERTSVASINKFDIQKESDRILLNRYAPAGVLVNDNLDILQFRGQTGAYLEPVPGLASFHLMKMVRKELRLELRNLILKARKHNTHSRKEHVSFQLDNIKHVISIEVIPVRSPSREYYFLILFEESLHKERFRAPEQEAQELSEQPNVNDNQIRQLLHELSVTREYLQSIIGEQEGTNEELRSALEELQSSNEELQSTNEEMETAKEELQSTNEEMTTVNEELQQRNLELSNVNNDLINLLAIINIPIVMLSSDLRIRRFTPMAEKVLNLIPTDVGRPISNIRPNLNIGNLKEILLDVMDNLTTQEMEVQDNDDYWYLMRVRPYRTLENKIDGVVIILLDIDGIKRAQAQLRDHGIKPLHND